jgi:hypothetical protein
MSGQTIVGALIGLGIGYFLTIPFYVFLAFQDSMWTRRAYRLAGQSNIALPANLAGRVARFLRAQYLFSIPALTVVIVVFDVVLYGDNTQQRDWTLWFRGSSPECRFSTPLTSSRRPFGRAGRRRAIAGSRICAVCVCGRRSLRLSSRWC